MNVQNEIKNDLNTIWAGENVDELRLRQKYLFQFGFIVDCIYAYFMDDEENNIDIVQINALIATKVTIVQHHPLYAILNKNICANKEAVRIFIKLINLQNEVGNFLFLIHSLEIKIKFLAYHLY